MAQFTEATWLYHAEHGPRKFNPGDEHPGASWSDTPFDEMPAADPRDVELQNLRQKVKEQAAEIARLERAVAAKKKTDPTE
jgi:hypothetical protein